MGVVIRACGISEVDNDRGSVEHATLAVRGCVEAAGIEMQEIDLLINIGVYRDNNLCEPSMCSQIQHELGLNLDPNQFAVPGLAFSFDLMNGACGFLSAVKVASSTLSNGNVKRAVIVSSDAHPTGKKPADFPHTHCGGAVMLELDPDEGRGFRDIVVQTETGPDGGRGSVNIFEAGDQSRYEIWVAHDDDYVDRLLAFSAKTAAGYLEANSVSTEGLKLITSQPGPAFGAELARRLGIDPENTLTVEEAYGDPHTSALSIGYALAKRRGQVEPGDRVLFVNAGMGLTVGCGLYVV